MNRVSPKALLNSKWTRSKVTNKEKHFVVIAVEINEDQQVTECIIQAVMTKSEYAIDWRDLKMSDNWLMGWK
ncbi:TIGR02450 family Trp-rich protein [Paraglaciecola aquimarina]|uniref:TIGR02450 family Trp-rich protein n=1 Tax=Paraglaciecola algarum TaxID=3050085 RepID=A0ABS9DEG4_9ALTE|nr:TIGR02450 family Trp-rich protein [Paraglaciecola sp. G1-23]MCF2950437.1 TIGR02450 family Trp-rich protein [Paraglaciecola sp. G1-23]